MTNVRWQVFLAILAIILLISAFAFFAWSPALVALPQYGESYAEGLVGAPDFLNPLLCHSQVDRDLCRLIFDGLTEFSPRGEIVPCLAERWEISTDGTSYTFHLRPDVRWHDGAPLTSEDVLFTIDSIQSPDFPGPPELAAFWRDIRVEALSMHTIRFSLPQPFAPFLSFTSMGLLPVHLLSAVPLQELPDHPFNRAPVGTGSFKVKELTAEHVVLEPNLDDFRPRPYLNSLEFQFFPDAASLLRAYQDERIDGFGRIPPENLLEVWQDETLAIYFAPLSSCALVFLNQESPIFADKAVRQALLYATDRQALVDRAAGGQGVVVHSPIPLFSWAYDPAVTKYGYDLARAKELLTQAGWEAGSDGQPRQKGGQFLLFDLLADDEPVHRAAAQELASQWARLGVHVSLRIVAPSALLEDHLLPRAFDAALFELRLSGDPDPYALWHSTQTEKGGLNFSGWHDDASDLALEGGRLERDPAVRKRLYDRFQQRFAEEVPALLLYSPVYGYALSRRVHNVQIGPLWDPSDRFRTVRQWYIATRRVLRGEAVATPVPPETAAMR